VDVTIPPNSNTGQKLRLKGKGVAGQGDQFVRLQVVLPDGGDDELRKFLKKWSKRDTKPQRP
jgi:DnaJ-class molecular chaperone